MQDCTLKIDIQGGGRSRRHGGALFFWFCFALLLGGVAALGYVHWYGVPTWLPIRERGARAGLWESEELLHACLDTRMLLSHITECWLISCNLAGVQGMAESDCTTS